MNAYFCVEDALSRAVLSRLLTDLLGEVGLTELQPDQGGYGKIKKKFYNYCQLSERSSVFILIDLDLILCTPRMRKSWLKGAGIDEPLPQKMCFMIAKT